MTRSPGTRRLLRDLLAFGRLQRRHPTARERLETQLGHDLTRRLIESLRTVPESSRPHRFRDTG